jgi:hypothetical protein
MISFRVLAEAAGLIFRLPLAGRRQNKDTWVSVNSTYAEPVPD